MCITAEATQEELHLLMNHGVVHDHFFKAFFLSRVWQFAIEQEVANFQEITVIR